MKSALSYIFLILISSSIYAQETVKFRVRVVNSQDGVELADANVTVSYVLSENIITPEKEKRWLFYDVVKGAEVKVEVKATGFYDEHLVFDTETFYDNDVVHIGIYPKSSATLLLSLIDYDTSEPLVGSIQITSNGINSIQNTTKEQPEVEFSYDMNGDYIIKGSAPGYKSSERKVELYTSSGNSKMVITLLKTILNQKITFKDKETGQTIKPPVLVEIINVSDKDKTTIWNAVKGEFEFTEGDTYNLTVEAKDYKKLFTQIKPINQDVEIFLEPIQFTPIAISVHEAGTGKKINTEITVTAPDGNSSKVASNSQFTPDMDGEYIFYFELPGYGRYELRKESQTDEKEAILSFEVLRDVDVNIIIQDSVTHSAIQNAIITVTKDKEEPVKTSLNESRLSIKKAPFASLHFKIEAEGYENKEGQINPGNVSQNTVTVQLKPVEKITYSEYEFILQDARSNETINKTQLLILDEDNNTVETIYNSTKGVYRTHRIKDTGVYKINARAEGYQDHYTNLDRSDQQMVLKMIPQGLREIVITVYDEYTKDIIALDDPRFELAESKILPYTERNKEYLISLKPNEPAKLTFQQPGYPLFANIISLDNIENDKLDIYLKKALYPLAVVITNELSQEQKATAKAEITYLNGNKVESVFNTDRNAYELESDPNEVLQIEINVPGFKGYKASNNRKDLAMFEIQATLEPIPEPEPPVVEDELIEEVVVAEPDPPVIVEKEQPIVEPEPAPKPVVDEKMVAEKGRRYLMDGIHFEQSKTIMMEGSYLVLNNLLKFMNENPMVKIEVSGHTDGEGDERQNRRLSEFRARTVANWLFNHGIDSERISTVGKGSTEPIAPRDNEENKAQNRRIEIMVIEVD